MQKRQLMLSNIFVPSYLDLLKNPVHCLALGFGSGAVRKAPGTFGSLVALPLLVVLLKLPLMVYIPMLVVTFFLSVLVCETTASVMLSLIHI